MSKKVIVLYVEKKSKKSHTIGCIVNVWYLCQGILKKSCYTCSLNKIFKKKIVAVWHSFFVSIVRNKKSRKSHAILEKSPKKVIV